MARWWTMGSSKRTLLAVPLLVCTVLLPFYFLEFRTEQLHCGAVGPLKFSCQTDNPNTLVFARRTEIRPPGLADVSGLYARTGYSARTAAVLGILAPALCLGFGLVLVIGSIRRAGSAQHSSPN
jgi:hypothetical protein